MVLGIVMGTAIFNLLPDARVVLAADINLIAMLFLRLIKMIIAPLKEVWIVSSRRSSQ